MKIHVYVEKEVEVDVSAEQVIEAINSLPEPDQLPALLNGINCFANFMNKVTDDHIAVMSESQRKTIGEYLEQQSKRYLPAGYIA